MTKTDQTCSNQAVVKPQLYVTAWEVQNTRVMMRKRGWWMWWAAYVLHQISISVICLDPWHLWKGSDNRIVCNRACRHLHRDNKPRIRVSSGLSSMTLWVKEGAYLDIILMSCRFFCLHLRISSSFTVVTCIVPCHHRDHHHCHRARRRVTLDKDSSARGERVDQHRQCVERMHFTYFPSPWTCRPFFTEKEDGRKKFVSFLL